MLATFDKDATNLFTKVNGRDFLEVRGGILALMEYTVVSSLRSAFLWRS